MFHDIECLLVPALKDSHSKFLYNRGKKLTKAMSLDLSQDSTLLQIRKSSEHLLNDTTPGSSPRGNESPPKDFFTMMKKPKYLGNQGKPKPLENFSREFGEIVFSERKRELDLEILNKSPKTPEADPIKFKESFKPKIQDSLVIQEDEIQPRIKIEKHKSPKLEVISEEKKIQSNETLQELNPKIMYKINENTQKLSRGPSLANQTNNKSFDIQDFYLKDWKTLVGLELTNDDHDYIDETKKEIKTSTVDRLIDIATNNSQSDPGNENLFVFMLTYRSFISPNGLLDKLRICFYTPPPKDLPIDKYLDFTSADLTRIRLRVTKLIRFWLEHHFYEFDNDLLLKLEIFVSDMRKTKGEYFASIVDTTIKKSKQKYLFENRKSETILNDKTLPPIIPKNKGDYSNFFAWSEKEISRQITFYEFDLFKKIHPKEFLNKNFQRENIKELAPNVDTFLNWFNRFSSWVSFKILEAKEPNERVKVLSKFIKVANECKNLNNFNGAFEIMSATTITPIHRLQKTWSLLSRRTKGMHDELSQYFNTQNNFKNLRTLTQSASPPAIPYLGTYLRDLTYINDIQKNEINGRINFNKRRQIGLLISEMQKFSSVPYHIYPINILRQTLLNSTFHEDKDLLNLSFEREKKETKKSVGISIPFFTSNPDVSLFNNPIQNRDSQRLALSFRKDQSKMDLTSPLPSKDPIKDKSQEKVERIDHKIEKVDKLEKVDEKQVEKCLTPEIRTVEKSDKVVLETKSSSDNDLTKSLKEGKPLESTTRNISDSEDEKVSPVIGFLDNETEKLKKEIERLNNQIKENEDYKQKYEDLLHDHKDTTVYIDQLESKIKEYRDHRQSFKNSLNETQIVIDDNINRLEKIEKKLKKIQNFEERIENIEYRLGIEANVELDFNETIEFLEKKSKEFLEISKKLKDSHDVLEKKLM